MEDLKYKVQRIYRESGRRKTLENNLTREEAKRVVKRHPNNTKSMVTFTEQ